MIGIGIYQWQPHWDWNKSYFPPALSFLSLKFRLTLTSACLFLFVMGQVHIGFTHTNKSRCRCVYTRPESSLICILQRYIHMSSMKKKKTSIPRKQTIHILLFSFLFSTEHFFFFVRKIHISMVVLLLYIYTHTRIAIQKCVRVCGTVQRERVKQQMENIHAHISSGRDRETFEVGVFVLLLFSFVSHKYTDTVDTHTDART